MAGLSFPILPGCSAFRTAWPSLTGSKGWQAWKLRFPLAFPQTFPKHEAQPGTWWDEPTAKSTRASLVGRQTWQNKAREH